MTPRGLSEGCLKQAASTAVIPGTENRKLRLSCDSCHGAKVKCTKDRPSCSRCSNLGSACVYSQSRRAGKPKRAVKDSFSTTRTASPQTVVHSLPSPLSLSATDVNGDVEMDLGHAWNMELSNSSIRRPSVQISLSRPPQHPDDYFGSPKAHKAFNRRSLDSNYRPSFYSGEHEQSDVLDFSSFHPEMASTHGGLTPGWLTDMASSNHNTMSISVDDMFQFPDTSDLPCPGFTPDQKSSVSTMDRSDSTTCSTACPNNVCECTSILHETLSTLNSAALSWDRLLAVNKAAVTRITEYMGCNCVPEIASIMLLSMIITKIVRWYQQTQQSPGRGLEDIGVTMGVLKMDSEEEQQIKIVLIQSELRKVKLLISQARERFDKHLNGKERQLYEAHMTFLEQGLHETMKSQ